MSRIADFRTGALAQFPTFSEQRQKSVNRPFTLPFTRRLQDVCVPFTLPFTLNQKNEPGAFGQKKKYCEVFAKTRRAAAVWARFSAMLGPVKYPLDLAGKRVAFTRGAMHVPP